MGVGAGVLGVHAHRQQVDWSIEFPIFGAAPGLLLVTGDVCSSVTTDLCKR